MEATSVEPLKVPGGRARAAAGLVLPWVGWPTAGALWAIWHLRKSYFFYDEWSLISIVTHLDAVDGMTLSFNGHLWMLQYWLYRIQVSVFGLDSHFFICACFVVALIALHLSMTAVLRAHGLPRQFCLMVGGLMTYLGAASQDFIFAVQVSPILSMAAGLFAVAIIVRSTPTPRAITQVALLLTASVVLESGIALSACVFVGILAILRWKSSAVWALLPALLVNVWWYTTADLGQQFPASFENRVSFGVRLAFQSVGSIVGNGQVAGALLTGAAATLILIALVRRWLNPVVLSTLVAGMASAVVTVAALSYARAGLPGFSFLDFNRYQQFVAIPMVMATVPSLAIVVRKAVVVDKPVGEIARRVPHLLILGAFLLGLSPAARYSKIFDFYNTETRRQVVAATVVIGHGCPSGESPDMSSFPVDYNPQITTQLLSELVDSGALSVGPIDAVDPAVTDRMCP